MTKYNIFRTDRAKALAVKYRHFVWTALVPLFLVSFILVERTVTTDYWVSYSKLDDLIPFIPEFIVFYFLWYPLLFATGLYLLLRDAPGYRRYMWALMSGFFFTLLLCLIVPNGQDLRPESFASETIFTSAVGAIYSIDTNTNVMPSMHVIGTCVVTIAVFDTPGLKNAAIRIGVVVLGLLINLSTVFVKQHSILDIFAGLALCIVLYGIFYVVVKRRQIGTATSLKRKIAGADTPAL